MRLVLGLCGVSAVLIGASLFLAPDTLLRMAGVPLIVAGGAIVAFSGFVGLIVEQTAARRRLVQTTPALQRTRILAYASTPLTLVGCGAMVFATIIPPIGLFDARLYYLAGLAGICLVLGLSFFNRIVERRELEKLGVLRPR